MRLAYEGLLRLYPTAYRATFGPEMIAVFEEVKSEQRAGGRIRYSLFLLAEFAGLWRGAILEWLADARGRFTVALCGGLILTAVLQGLFYGGFHQKVGEMRVALSSQLDAAELLVVTCLTVFLTLLFSIACVFNLTALGRRARR